MIAETVASVLERRWFKRYLARVQAPLGSPVPAAGGAYAASDEVLLSFGHNVNENVFDQNRLALLLGYRFGPKFRLEGGFLQQVVQLPREIGGRNVFQYNNRVVLNTVFTLDLRKAVPQ